MSLFTRGEANGVESTHHEGQVPTGTDSDIGEHWGDNPTIAHQSLRLGFINTNTFPASTVHHKNGCLIQLVNDNHLNGLGLVDLNTYWAMLLTEQQLQERTKGWFNTHTHDSGGSL